MGDEFATWMLGSCLYRKGKRLLVHCGDKRRSSHDADGHGPEEELGGQ